MTFQISALDVTEFQPLFAMSDEDLRAANAKRVTIDTPNSAPCRISLEQADVGETVILTNYQHHNTSSPYDAKHAIYIRDGVAQADLAPGEVPTVLTHRPLSVRGFTSDGDICDADLAEIGGLPQALDKLFENPDVAFAHIHYAARGCFAARADRA